MRFVTCIAHPGIQKKVAFVRAAKRADLPVQWTRRAGDLIPLARRALAAGCRQFVVAGGDGSLHEATNVLCSGPNTLGIVPLGTGNDLARLIGIPEDPAAALNIALKGRPKKIDVGVMKTGPEQAQRFFHNETEVGFGTQALHEACRVGRIAGRALAYPVGILTALARYRAFPIQMTIDGQFIDVRRLTALIICNGRYFGRGLMPAPKAELDDGWLDILLIENYSHWEIARKVPTLKQGPPDDDPRVRSFRGRKIRVESKIDLDVEADGEMVGTLPLSVELMPKSLSIRCP